MSKGKFKISSRARDITIAVNDARNEVILQSCHVELTEIKIHARMKNWWPLKQPENLS